MRLDGKQVVVIGLGASGVAAARVLLDEGARVRVTESRPRAEVADAAGRAGSAGAEVLAGGHEAAHLDGAELVVTSPGVPEQAEVIRWAQERRLPVWSELELGARLARCPYIGITGTNGKTTTTEMVAAAMREAGLDALACGNIGHPFSLAAGEGHQALAVEASSFQLRFHESFHPRVSVLLNLAPDHLDWHRSLHDYRESKRRIYALQSDGDTHVGNRDDPHAAGVSGDAPCAVAWFTLDAPREGEVGYEGGELVTRLGPPHRLGPLSTETLSLRTDAAAAAAAAIAFGIDPESVGSAMASFSPLPHRGTVVAEAGGVRFVDDSKASNPHAALAALEGLEGAVLVAGGRSKGIDLSPLAAATPRLAGVVAIGEAAGELAALFEGRVPVRLADSMEDAVADAYALASPGATVVLAPACASWDMFRDYGERGDRFAVAARALAERAEVRRA
ncbi:MAG: UDP-N-acetylmuramoyl-L-alanine--D-glutamate ligase [Actinomycetota bacterium]